MSQASLRCFETPSPEMIMERLRDHRQEMVNQTLLDFWYSSQALSLYVGAIMVLQRAGDVPADRLQGLRTHVLQLRSQLDALVSLIPVPQPTTTTTTTHQ